MATSASSTSISPLAARLGYLADLQKAEETYAEAWWTRPRPKRGVSRQQTPLRGSFSSEDVPHLGSSSEFPSPSPSLPSTPAEYVQEYFEQTQKNREMYDMAWRTAAEKHTLGVHDPHDPATKLNSQTRDSNPLAAQLDAFAKHEEIRGVYYEGWSSPSIGRSILVHEPRDSAIKIASSSTNFNLLAAQLRAGAEQYAREEAYDEAWIQAAKEGTITTRKSRKSATNVASQSPVINTLAAQLRAASDEEIAERSYADAWTRYGDITRYAKAIDAWKSYHLEQLRRENEYYNAWSDVAKTHSLTKPAAPKSEIKSTASQMAMFQDMHACEEEYDEAWISYSQRHAAMSPAPLRTPRRRPRLSVTRSPRPAYIRRLPVDVASPELPMMGFSAIDTVQDDEYVKAWAEKMKTTTITPANSLLLSPPSRKRFIPSSPRPKKRSDKGHFTWPEDLTEEEKLGLTTRGDLQPYLSSLLGKIVSFELVGQSEPIISPDQASSETPMQLVRRAYLKCQNHVVCQVEANISIISAPIARQYTQDPLPVFDVLRKLGRAAVVRLEQVGISPVNPETGRQAIWRRYSIVSGAFRCEVKETFTDRKMFSKEGCDLGKKVLIKDGLIMSPDGVDYLSLPL